MRFALASIALGALLFAGSAHAEDAFVEGTVLGADSTDLVVDLGSSRGATDGALVELWRPIRIKHPVTGQMLTDRFLVGKLKLTQVRPNLALAQPSGALSRVPQPGDVVRLARSTLAPFPTATPTPTPIPTGTGTPPAGVTITAAPADADAQTLSSLFDSLRGKQPQARAEAYEDYARSHPRSRFVQVLLEEAAAFRTQSATAPTAAGPTAAAKKPKAAMGARSFVPVDHAFAGAPLQLGIEFEGEVQGAVLYVFAPATGGYQPTPMTRLGNGYFEGTFSAQLVVAPSVQYFIEAAGEDGKMVAIEGSSTTPLQVEVEDKPAPMPAIPVRAQFAMWTDFAFWNTKKLNDYASQTEGLFGVRFGDTGVRALRTGFGVYRGVGATLAVLDAGEPASKVGLTYGYLETELAPASIYSIVLRAVVGLGQNGIGGGMQGFMRIGNDLKTNLLLGGEVLSGVGIRGIAQLEWSATPRVPIMFRTEVTNQPAGLQGGDVGVRLIAQAGYRFSDHVSAALRASYQGRTINHAGPGGGAAVEYTW